MPSPTIIKELAVVVLRVVGGSFNDLRWNVGYQLRVTGLLGVAVTVAELLISHTVPILRSCEERNVRRI